MNAVGVKPSDQQIISWLGTVPDPEIPVLSVVDLGLIREILWDGDRCVVVITPTYSGCPAMQEIASDIRQALAAQGLADARVETRLSPAWTTDWMTEKGRVALHSYGIAPPREKAIDISGITRRRTEVNVPCPLCGSLHTGLISHFGSTSCKALYRCNDCREPFDYFKAH